jgi:hypothetical protein
MKNSTEDRARIENGSLRDGTGPLGNSPHAEAYMAQLNAIERFRAVPTNWSTSPVVAPNAEQTAAAQHGLLMLLLEDVPAPKLVLLNDGTLAAFWRSGVMAKCMRASILMPMANSPGRPRGSSTSRLARGQVARCHLRWLVDAYSLTIIPL